jgi:indolepyruvate ferredoxin oxidoreductase
MRRKISLGPWFTSAFRVLRFLRKLRGTRLDPFGYAEVRRVERELIEEYRGTILRAFRAGDVDREAVLALAELPDMVRGYEDIKLANVRRYREELARLSEQRVIPSA